MATTTSSRKLRAAEFAGSALACVAVASPFHVAGLCGGGHITSPEVADGDRPLTTVVMMVGIWCGMVAVVCATQHCESVTLAAGVILAGFITYWLGAIELSRELCAGSAPGPGLWIGWAALIAAAWTIPVRLPRHE